MLKLFKRRAPAMTNDVRAEALTIRNLLDDPGLRAVMGDGAADVLVPPIRLDWRRQESIQRPRFGRRLLQRAA